MMPAERPHPRAAEAARAAGLVFPVSIRAGFGVSCQPHQAGTPSFISVQIWSSRSVREIPPLSSCADASAKVRSFHYMDNLNSQLQKPEKRGEFSLTSGGKDPSGGGHSIQAVAQLLQDKDSRAVAATRERGLHARKRHRFSRPPAVSRFSRGVGGKFVSAAAASGFPARGPLRWKAGPPRGGRDWKQENQGPSKQPPFSGRLAEELSGGSVRVLPGPGFGEACFAARARQSSSACAAWPVPGSRLRGGRAAIRCLPAMPMCARAGPWANARAGCSGGNFYPAG